MKKTLQFTLITMLFTLLGITNLNAQDSEEINRAEFFGGFSHNRIDTGITSEDIDEEFDLIDNRVGANGFNASITGNFSKYVGAKFDFSTHGKSETFDFDGESAKTKYRINNFLGGFQIKNNKKDGPRVKPFVHFLAGVARQTFTVESPSLSSLIGQPEFKTSSTNFALGIGGGLDVRVSKNIDIRVFQVDYNPTFVKDREFEDFTLDGQLQNNIRFSFGIVIH